MRTTIDIAEDVFLAVRELARREKKTAGQVISELARRGLHAGPGDKQEGNLEEFFGFRPLPKRGVVVTSELVNRLLDEELGY